jgi:hypothetical protein
MGRLGQTGDPRERLRAKKERLDGLRSLYNTYEQRGEAPVAGSYMWELRKKIHSVKHEIDYLVDYDGVAS